MDKGFTLIEVMLVIIVMGILFSAAYFKVPLDDFKLESQIESIAADLRWARKKAILDNESYIFRIYSIKQNINSNKIPYYLYIKKDGKNFIQKKGYYSSNLILYKTLGLKLVENDYYEWIRFTNTATARGGTIALAAPDKNAKKYIITVNQLGRVKIEK